MSNKQEFQSTLPVRGATAHIRRAFKFQKFQSTLPVRGATRIAAPLSVKYVYFNPRSPCGERPTRSVTATHTIIYFNPRSPCGERRAGLQSRALLRLDFNPRSPCGERRADGMRFKPCEEISIHAPRAGSDGISGDIPESR